MLMEELAQRLRKRRLASHFSQDHDLVLVNGIGKTLGYARLLRAFSDATEAAELRGVTPHTCRHTFASILIDQGATIEFVSDQLGHATNKTTWDIHVHLLRRRERADTARRELNSSNSAPMAFRSGASRDRTGDLLLAKQALSQLSYGPFAGRV